MKRGYRKFLLLLELLAVMLMILAGCSSQLAEDQGELIQRETEITVYG